MNSSLIYHHAQDKENYHIKRNQINTIKNVKQKIFGSSYEKSYLTVSASDAQIKKIVNKASFKEKTNDSQFISQYGAKIIQEQHNQQILGPFLSNHEIDSCLRARMLDWMIEVTTSYNFSPSSYFYSAYIMDRYYKKQKERIEAHKLHIIGVVSLHIASKMNQVFPLKIKTVFQKIAHKKFTKTQLIQTQNEIMKTLDYNFNCWTFYDHAMLKLTQIHQHQIQNRLCNLSQLQNELSKSKIDQQFKQMQKICFYVCLHVIFQYEFYSQSSLQFLAEGCVKVILEIMKIDDTPIFFYKTSLFLLQKMKHRIYNIMKSFSIKSMDLHNIFKFVDHKIISKASSFFI